jgi:uncharacterized phiE125 gp8 family phage protein
MADYVISSSGSAIVSLTEARRHLNISSTYDDAWLEDGIEAATQLVEDRTGRKYIAQTRKLTMRTFADKRYVKDRRIYPEKTPILGSSTVSITYVNTAGTTTTLPTSDYLINPNENPSRISEAYNATWPDTQGRDDDVTVNYVAGTSTVPPTVKLAVNMLLGHWYRTREAAIDRTFSEVPLGVEALLSNETVERYG